MIYLLVNPAAGGVTPARVRGAVAVLGGAACVVVRETQRAADERPLARDACDSGAQAIVVLGGDGTVSGAVSGMMQRTVRPPLGIVSAGTGNDFVRSLGKSAGDLEPLARAIARGATRRVDVGYVDDVPFINAAGFGFDAAVIEAMRTRRMTRSGETPSIASGSRLPLRAVATRLAYARAALRELAMYRGIDATVSCERGALPRDDEPMVDAGGLRVKRVATDESLAARSRYLMLAFANGACFGGGMRIAPAARLDDGLLDAVAIGDVQPRRRLALFLRAVLGLHGTHPKVRMEQHAHFTLTFDAPPLFESDGELHRARTNRVVVRAEARVLELYTV